jgi:Tfp pilus assembly protein PilP
MLIGLNLALLAAFWPSGNELLSGDPLGPATYRQASVPLPESGSRPEQPELARRLFRGEPAPERDVSPSSAAASPTMRLVGVVLTDERRVAVIELNGSALRVGEGDAVEGWQVTRIERRMVRLVDVSERRIELSLDLPVGHE